MNEMRMVRNKSIPHVDDARLVDALRRLHGQLHGIEAMAAFDGPRRQLVDLGRKALMIRDECSRRGIDGGVKGCRFCSN